MESIKEKEYFMLREEMMIYIKAYNTNVNIIVSGYPVLIAFLWSTNEPIMLFIPILFVALIFYVNQSYWEANCKIATYMNTFLGEIDIPWEKVHPIFDEIDREKNKHSIKNFQGVSLTYFIPLLASLFLSIFKLYLITDISKMTFDSSIRLILILILFMLFFCFFKNQQVKTCNRKENCKVIWEDIKNNIL